MIKLLNNLQSEHDQELVLHPSLTFTSNLERIILSIESQDWNLHLVDLADETRVLVILLHVAVPELAGGKPAHQTESLILTC